MAEPKRPQDHQQKQPTKAEREATAKADKRSREIVAEMMSTGIDLSPFTVDVSDGIAWAFNPDPMPADTERLRKAMDAISKSAESMQGAQEAFDELVDALRGLIIDEQQRKDFPKPNYGQKALMFFAMHAATGRDGFPTE